MQAGRRLAETILGLVHTSRECSTPPSLAGVGGEGGARAGLLWEAPGFPGWLGAAAKAAAVLGILVLSFALVYAWRSGDDLRGLGTLGYPGVFLLSFLSAATVLVPMPGWVAAAGGGLLWNPVVVGLVAGLGAATGELAGYFAGRMGCSAIQGRLGDRCYAAQRWLRRYGFWAILLAAAVPNPFFDAVGLAAGALAYPTARFWTAAAVGNCLKYLSIAHLGGAIPWPLG